MPPRKTSSLYFHSRVSEAILPQPPLGLDVKGATLRVLSTKPPALESHHRFASRTQPKKRPSYRVEFLSLKSSCMCHLACVSLSPQVKAGVIRVFLLQGCCED